MARLARVPCMFKNPQNLSPLFASSRQKSSVGKEPFMNGGSSVYIEEMYNSWLQNPTSVHKVKFLFLEKNF